MFKPHYGNLVAKLIISILPKFSPFCITDFLSICLEKGYKIMAKKLYVGNLSFDVKDQELQQAFSEYGEVTSATVVVDRYTEKSRGFGFVEFAQDEDAQKAKDAMNSKEFMGRTLKVDEARESRSRDRGSGGDYGSNRRSRF